MKPDLVTGAGHRRDDLSRLRPDEFRVRREGARKTVAYARVSSHEQKPDLERQAQCMRRLRPIDLLIAAARSAA